MGLFGSDLVVDSVRGTLPLSLVGGAIPPLTAVAVLEMLAIWIAQEEALARPASVPGRGLPLKNWKLVGLPLLLSEEVASFSRFLFSVIETVVERAVSFSTLVAREDWNSPPKSVSFAEGMSSVPYLLHEPSMASKSFDHLVPGMSSEAFPSKHSVC